MPRLRDLWAAVKRYSLVFWPIRFVLAILVGVIVVLCLPQAQDALFSAIVERAAPVWVLAATSLWAIQTWYWCRFLYSLPGERADRIRRDAAGSVTWLPRLLGIAVFLIVALFVFIASRGTPAIPDTPDSGPGMLSWIAIYVVCAVLFAAITVIRRVLFGPAVPLGELPALSRRASLGLGLAWLLLLAVAIGSAFIDYRSYFLLPDVELRRLVAAAYVLALAATTCIFLWHLHGALPRNTIVFVTLLMILNTGLFLLSIFAPAWTGAYLGPAAVLMLTAGLWVGGTSFFLALPGEVLRLPVTTGLIVVMLFFTFVPKLPQLVGNDTGDYDNHRLRELPGAVPVGDGDAKQDGRATVWEAFKAWRKQAPCFRYQGDDQPCVRPMILVAAQGGASRSGYWVADVLGALEDAWAGAHQADGENSSFHQSVFAISSVSGGSLGAAVYQRLVARKQALAPTMSQGSGKTPLCYLQGKDRAPSDSLAVCGKAVVAQDFLGPVFFSMFNGDLLQRVLPGDILPDRGEALETAWEAAWRKIVGQDDFAAPFHFLEKQDVPDAEAPPRRWLPLLLLNGASVKTGRRIITADVAITPVCKSADLLFGGADLPNTLDFFCLTRRQIRLSTAVHNSARFPYISPAGTLWADDGAGHRWRADRIVDGGYVEAQGATTLSDLLSALAANWTEDRKNSIRPEGVMPSTQSPDTQPKDGMPRDWPADVVPIVISIQNDPTGPQPDCMPPDARGAETPSCRVHNQVETLGDEADTMSFQDQVANDLLAPLLGLFSSRTGRGAYAARALAVNMYNRGKSRDGAADQTGLYRINLGEYAGTKPAMSWYLSARSRRDMDNDLCKDAAAVEQTGLPDKTKRSIIKARQEFEDTLNKLGRSLNIPDLLARIRRGDGCQNVEHQGLAHQGLAHQGLAQ